MSQKKITHILIALISNKVLIKPTQTRHQWIPHLIRNIKIFVWCLYGKQNKSYKRLFTMQ